MPLIISLRYADDCRCHTLLRLFRAAAPRDRWVCFVSPSFAGFFRFWALMPPCLLPLARYRLPCWWFIFAAADDADAYLLMLSPLIFRLFTVIILIIFFCRFAAPLMPLPDILIRWCAAYAAFAVFAMIISLDFFAAIALFSLSAMMPCCHATLSSGWCWSAAGSRRLPLPPLPSAMPSFIALCHAIIISPLRCIDIDYIIIDIIGH